MCGTCPTKRLSVVVSPCVLLRSVAVMSDADNIRCKTALALHYMTSPLSPLGMQRGGDVRRGARPERHVQHPHQHRVHSHCGPAIAQRLLVRLPPGRNPGGAGQCAGHLGGHRWAGDCTSSVLQCSEVSYREMHCAGQHLLGRHLLVPTSS